jgi:predicted dehydrogenase
MDRTQLKTAILGLNEKGQLALEAATDSQYMCIQALADKDIGLAGEYADRYKCTAYDDYRQLITQNELDCLIVAEDMHVCEEYVRMAIQKKINILKFPPPARNFEEAAELVSLAQEQNITFAIANTLRFAQSFAELHRLLSTVGDKQSEAESPARTPGERPEAFLISAEYCSTKIGGQPNPSWMDDAKLAGGGVLLYGCYQIIDEIVWNFSLPQQIYALAASTASDKRQRQYQTEDIVAVTMKFNDGLLGSITASRDAHTSDGCSVLKIFTKGKSIAVNRKRLVINDNTGGAGIVHEYPDSRAECMGRLLENFSLAILSPEEHKLSGTAQENLSNMAFIEAAYLSARTGSPEEPARVVKMPQFDKPNV